MQCIKSPIDYHPVFEIIRIKNHEFMFLNISTTLTSECAQQALGRRYSNLTDYESTKVHYHKRDV